MLRSGFYDDSKVLFGSAQSLGKVLCNNILFALIKRGERERDTLKGFLISILKIKYFFFKKGFIFLALNATDALHHIICVSFYGN